MLDRWTSALVRPVLTAVAVRLKSCGIKPDQVTLFGFIVGMAAIPAIALHHYLAGLFLIFMSRMADGLDGALARLETSTDSGAYLDIVLDFIFYSGVVFAFALADPESNSLAAAALLFTFTGTGCSFLSFAILAERRGLQNIHYPQKGLYYLGGLAEGTETLMFFCAFCLFPAVFSELALFFAVICAVTAVTRVIGGYRTIKKDEEGEKGGVPSP